MATKKTLPPKEKTKATNKKSLEKSKNETVTNPVAVISFRSHQYLIKPGDVIDVEKLDLKPGEKISPPEILLYSDPDHTLVGTPFVDGVKVELEHLETKKTEKIRVARYKAKSRYRKVKGHRQTKTKLKVLSLTRI
jgi:large subunit ribosomal protein L21